MPLTKQYLRYEHSITFGAVCGRKSNLLLHSEPPTGDNGRRVLIVSPAAEDILIWDWRREEKTAVLRGGGGGGGKKEVVCLCGSGGVLAAGCEDGTIHIWNISSSEPTFSFSGHKSAVTSLMFDSTGTRLVSGSKDTTVVLWDVAGGCGLFRLRGHKAPITGCRWLHHGNVLITCSKDCLVKLWNLNTQHCFQTLVHHHSEVLGIEIVAMETRLVTASSDGELQVFSLSWEVEEEEEEEEGRVGKKRKASDRGEISTKEVNCEKLGSLVRQRKERVIQLMSDSATGRLLGCLSGHLLELYLIKTEEEKEKMLKKKKKKLQKKMATEGDLDIDSIKLSPSDEIPSLYSLHHKDKIRSFHIHSLSDTKMMIALGLHSNSIELLMFNLETTPPNHTHLRSISAPGHRSDIRAVCFNNDDSAIASGDSKSIKIWSRSTQHCLHTLSSGHVLSLTFIPGDRHIVAGTKTGEVEMYEVGSGELIERIEAHTREVQGLRVTPDQHGLVTGSSDCHVKFWNFELTSDSNRRRLSLCHTRTLKMAEEVLTLQHSPDGRLLAIALLDSTVKVFFSDSLKFFLSLYGHKLPVLAMDISTDSTLLVTSSSDKNIRIWGLDFGDCHKSLFAHDNSIMSVKFVPETHLVFSCGKDQLIKCWDADSFEHVMTLEGHCGEVWCLDISKDGDTLVTGSHDHSLRLWTRTDEPLILSEEREKERETQFEEAVVEGGETVVPGEERDGEVVMAGRKTMESMKAAEQLIEALAMYREERAKLEEWEEECKYEHREVPLPKPHPLLVAMGDITVEEYVLKIMRRIKSSELDEALLVMPFSEVTDFLPLLNHWLKNDSEVELSCRCLLFLLRVHHHQIVSSPILMSVVESLKHHTRQAVENLRDLYGYNLAGLHSMRYGMETAGTTLFADTTARLNSLKMKKKLKTVS